MKALWRGSFTPLAFLWAHALLSLEGAVHGRALGDRWFHGLLLDRRLRLPAQPVVMNVPLKCPPYRITMVDGQWHVRRPHGTLAHAFDELDDALTFVGRDSRGTAELVEILSGTLYMVKPIA
jgi:hypothetical protein